MEVPETLPNLIIVLDDDDDDVNQISILQETYYNNYQSLKKRMFIYLYIWVMLILCLAGITLLMVKSDKTYGGIILALGLSLCLGSSCFK